MYMQSKKRPSKPIPRACHFHKVDTCHAEYICYTTTIIINWEDKRSDTEN